MLHDRKTDIYALLPQKIVPATTIIVSRSAVDIFIKNNNLSFPLIIKPNVGVKGFKVTKVNDAQGIDSFFAENDMVDREWLIQEFLNQEKEYSVLFYRYPKAKKHGVSSFVEKEYPFVIGDGKKTLKVLLHEYRNPYLLRTDVVKRLERKLDSIPKKSEEVILDFIGNYSRGAKFYSRMNFVDQEMAKNLNSMFQNAKGLNFFRVDFKANSIDDFLNGDYKILEVNGMKSEPLHIYDPKSSFWNNVKILNHHWKIIEDISREQKELCVDVPSFRNGLKSWMLIKKLVK